MVIIFENISERLWQKSICEDQENQSLTCSNDDEVIEIVHAKLLIATDDRHADCSTPNQTSNMSDVNLLCKFNSDVLKKVATKCHGKMSCNLSVKSIEDGRCPAESKFLRIKYNCVQKPNSIYAGMLPQTVCIKDAKIS